MQPWLETLGVAAVAIAGIALGLLTKKTKSRIWLVGSAFSIALIFSVGLVRRIDGLRFVAPFSWVSAGRNEFVVLSFAVPMAFAILIPRLSRRREKILTTVLAAVVSVLFFVYPFMIPAFVRETHANLKTFIAADGTCLQTTDYTCGPAASVTALRQFGINAEEGELAVLGCTTPQTGTPDDLVAKAIEKRYGNEGVRCVYRHFDSIAQLKGKCPTIAVVKFSFLVDHYVTVLEVLDDKVIVGDPLHGRQELSYDEFGKKWRFAGIVVSRQ
ncbi:MAG: cysteine peptidase family C39 domain-containing protein [Planctomycetota bacterium]|jgi:hypothetical protein